MIVKSSKGEKGVPPLGIESPIERGGGQRFEVLKFKISYCHKSGIARGIHVVFQLAFLSKELES